MVVSSLSSDSLSCLSKIRILLGEAMVEELLALWNLFRFSAMSEGIDVVREDPFTETTIVSLFQDMAAFLLSPVRPLKLFIKTCPVSGDLYWNWNEPV